MFLIRFVLSLRGSYGHGLCAGDVSEYGLLLLGLKYHFSATGHYLPDRRIVDIEKVGNLFQCIPIGAKSHNI